jgi:hypothetical protein
VDNSDQKDQDAEASHEAADQRDETVLTSVARVVGAALGNISSTASRVLSRSTNELAPRPEGRKQQIADRVSSRERKSAKPATTSVPISTAARPKPARLEKRDSRTLRSRTKAADSPPRSRARASAKDSAGQTKSRQKAKKKAKAHRRTIKRSNSKE